MKDKKMEKEIEKLIKGVLKSLNIEDSNFIVEHPTDLKMGDYSTNVAMVYAKELKISPRDLAEKIKKALEKKLPKEIEKIEIAGAGFINFYLSREFFIKSINNILEQKENWGKNSSLAGKKVMVEYTQPNPFKPFHIGHLMSNTIGESISRIIEFSGAKTIRANYQGDVGPHVAKAIYDLLLKGSNYLRLVEDTSNSISIRAFWIGKAYINGSNLYNTDKNAKKEIDIINKKIYDRSDKKINKVYDLGKDITLKAFEEIYKTLGTKFNYYFFESEVAPIGEKIVRDNVGKIFKESNGAIIFYGENYDKKLHTRVFINSQGLPTYETKEVGLTVTKFNKEKDLDFSLVITAIEQGEYMKVVQKAISLLYPNLEKRMKHITHGMMKLSTGKMSSRKGNVVTGESLISDSLGIIREKIAYRGFNETEQINISRQVGISALKYSILKSSLGSDIIYDFKKSISFEGDSGPYLQYTAVRADSILEKAKKFKVKNEKNFPAEISSLEKLLYQFPEVIKYSYNLFEPHHVTTYLTDLASAFNSFYGNTKILNEENKYISYHLDLVKAFYQTMENGLWLLGIEVPKKM